MGMLIAESMRKKNIWLIHFHPHSVLTIRRRKECGAISIFFDRKIKKKEKRNWRVVGSKKNRGEQKKESHIDKTNWLGEKTLYHNIKLAFESYFDVKVSAQKLRLVPFENNHLPWGEQLCSNKSVEKEEKRNSNRLTCWFKSRRRGERKRGKRSSNRYSRTWCDGIIEE